MNRIKDHGKICHPVSDSEEERGRDRGVNWEGGGHDSFLRNQESSEFLVSLALMCPKTLRLIFLWERASPLVDYQILPARTREEMGFFGVGVLVVPLHYLLTVWSWMRPLPSLGLSFPSGC